LITPIEFVVFAHRPHISQSKVIESLARYYNGTVKVTVLRTPGTCQENCNRALDLATSPTICLLDEDIEFVEPIIDPMLEAFDRYPNLGVLGCTEAKAQDVLEAILKVPIENRGSSPITLAKWTPTYVSMVRRDRIGNCRFDERIPGAKGMGDLDFCLQVRQNAAREVGFYSGVVYHPDKSSDDVARAKEGFTTLALEHSWYPAQAAYMREKWGRIYEQAVR